MPKVPESLRQFAFSVLASLIAAGIALAIPGVGRLFVTHGAFLDVSTAPESVGDLSTLRISAINPGDNALDPLEFHANFHGKILDIGISAPGSQTVSIDPGTGDPAWAGVLGKNEQLTILVVSRGLMESPDVAKLFTGKSIVLGSRGTVEKQPFVVRLASDVQLASYFVVAKVVGGVVVLVGVSWIALLVQKRKRSGSPTSSGVEGKADDGRIGH
jgi:hypothetical protein